MDLRPTPSPLGPPPSDSVLFAPICHDPQTQLSDCNNSVPSYPSHLHSRANFLNTFEPYYPSLCFDEPINHTQLSFVPPGYPAFGYQGTSQAQSFGHYNQFIPQFTTGPLPGYLTHNQATLSNPLTTSWTLQSPADTLDHHQPHVPLLQAQRSSQLETRTLGLQNQDLLPRQRDSLHHDFRSVLSADQSQLQAGIIASRKRRLTSAEDPTRRSYGPGHTDSALLAGSSTWRESRHASSMAQRPSTNSQSNMNQGTSAETAIDLTGSPTRVTPTHTTSSRNIIPPFVQQPQSRRNTGAGDVPVPLWQPDDAVSNCFVCGNQYSFFLRRHHCRRCGRVVCASCSPHRITLPRQFIVQPPSLVDLQNEEGSGYISGGEEVRVCNPCVPDPNYNPPSHNQSPFAVSGGMNVGVRSSIHTTESPSRIAHPNHSVAPGIIVPGSGRAYHLSTGFPQRPGGHRTSYSTTNMPTALQYHQYHPQTSGSASSSTAPQSMPHIYGPPPGAYRGSMIPQDLSSFFTTNQPAHASSSRPPHVPRREIAEEDECPVCGEELPSKGPNGEETERDAHIRECIDVHNFSTSAPQASTSTIPTTDGNPRPLTGRARRMTKGHMLVYTASEKDCIGPDGLVQECIICLEDFEEEEELARLECLCKFHRSCVRQWWDTKGVGSCPTHQLHD